MSLFRKEKVVDPQLIFIDNGLVATTATAGSGSLPAAPVGFIVITVAGVSMKLPYYNV